MYKGIVILWIVVLGLGSACAQDGDTLLFQGQLSAWLQVNPEEEVPVWIGARYIPQLGYQYRWGGKHLLDFEFSANVYQGVGFHPRDTLAFDALLKPYRILCRYALPQFEVRLGLQKINFGSASMFRPLMWFDSMDPRDPLKLTDGVWGVLGRYYWLNNANLWLWGLYGNSTLRSWEIGATRKTLPEFGGRFQHPVPAGEAAFTMHYRRTDTTGFSGSLTGEGEIPEIRLGVDGKWDIGPGVWVEGAWFHKTVDLGMLTNQLILNTGADMTLSAGNGISVSGEHLMLGVGSETLPTDKLFHLTGLSASYPISLFDQVSILCFLEWEHKQLYSFVSWRRQMKHITLFVMAHWSPDDQVAAQIKGLGSSSFSGRGVQIMITFNH